MIVDPASLPVESATPYPAVHADQVRGRHRQRLSPALGLTKFGVNLLRVEPGAQSSARHWHSKQDEFVYVLEGEVVLVSDEGETPLKAGMAAGFPGGNPNGHTIANRSDADAYVLEVGDRPSEEDVTYPDIDMANAVRGGKPHFTRKDGSGF
ncbi:MAG: cupin domain-containing protein [Alphaproteobacteria bacterium]|nr:cupin domain-containing protein [Alphaproteobacteria bacterium]